MILVVFGLSLFEIISSIDNAVVNADVLATMSPRWRKWFLFYGIAFAVFVMRGLLPLLIVYFSAPGITLADAFAATFSSSGQAKQIINAQKPILLAAGGVFLIFLFVHWLFLETKRYVFFLERHIHKHYYFWFYAVVSLMLLVIVWTTLRLAPSIALGAVVGSTSFFIVSGFKENVAQKERELLHASRESGKTNDAVDISKVLYLELIDATFSIDGVLGAFAFTVSVPLILIGNGIGALVVRYFTVHGVKTVQKYAYLKNGAMYSIGFLGIIMMAESLGREIPLWVSPVITFCVVGLFLYLSHRELAQRDALPAGRE